MVIHKEYLIFLCDNHYLSQNPLFLNYVLNQIISEIESGNTCIGILLHHERIGKETYCFLDNLIEIILEYGSIVDFKSLLEGYKND